MEAKPPHDWFTTNEVGGKMRSMTERYRRSPHAVYEIRVWCPKYRYAVLEGKIKKRYWGQHFWARGYFVSTIGIDEQVIKRYIKSQQEVKDQMKLWK